MTAPLRPGPLVVLHDHLDGGVRPATVLELAGAAGLPTPTDDPAGLAAWMTLSPDIDLSTAWERFALVISVLQTGRALRRVAREAVEDLAADGVVHAELRFAPLEHTRGDLDGDRVLEAVLAGIADAADTGTTASLIVCGLREQDPARSLEAAYLAARWADRGVVGFDLAGLEPDHPAHEHAAAFDVAREAGLGLTVHAGEMDGAYQVADAVASCRPHRLGHAWRLIDDCRVVGGRIVELGPTARVVREQGLPLETCVTSNACLGLDVADHPVRLLADAGFRITLSPDDRTITTTTPTREFELVAREHGMDRVELAAMAERAAVAAFGLSDEARAGLVRRVHEGWAAHPARLVHLVGRDAWAAAGDPYLPAGFTSEGFVHLSALHQVLGVATSLFAGRQDLVALVVDAHLLHDAIVWEPGTGTAEWFPHLYGALPRHAVLAEVPFPPGPDGVFLLPPALVRAVRRRGSGDLAV